MGLPSILEIELIWPSIFLTVNLWTDEWTDGGIIQGIRIIHHPSSFEEITAIKLGLHGLMMLYTCTGLLKPWKKKKKNRRKKKTQAFKTKSHWERWVVGRMMKCCIIFILLVWLPTLMAWPIFKISKFIFIVLKWWFPFGFFSLWFWEILFPIKEN